MCTLCDARDRPPPDNDLKLVTALLDDPTALNSEVTSFLGLPDVPDDDGEDDA